MTKPQVVEPKQLNHMLLAVAGDGKTKGYSQYPIRDKALLLVLYGTGMTATELATLPVRAYLTPAGAIKANSMIPIEIAFNGKTRHLKWANKRVADALDQYLALRLQLGQGVTNKKAAYRGLEPDSPIFLTGQGEPFGLNKKKSEKTGLISYTCNALSQHISKLHTDCGVPNGSGQSARRTLAVLTSRAPQGEFGLRELAEMLGISVSSARRLAGQDSRKMAGIVAKIGGSFP